MAAVVEDWSVMVVAFEAGLIWTGTQTVQISVLVT